MKGAFISVEGVDGAGKTTHIDFIQSWFSARGIAVTRTREPGGTALGEALRDILLNGIEAGGSAARRRAAISHRAELLLIFAARAQHLDEVIAPALEAGQWVLCDRFIDSTYAYQGGGRGLPVAAIETLERWLLGGVDGDVQSSPPNLTPDLTVLLDAPVEVGLARAQHRGGPPDRFERQTPQFKQAVRQVFLDRAVAHAPRIQRVDSNQPLAQVRADLQAVLETFWQARSAGRPHA